MLLTRTNAHRILSDGAGSLSHFFINSALNNQELEKAKIQEGVVTGEGGFI